MTEKNCFSYFKLSQGKIKWRKVALLTLLWGFHFPPYPRAVVGGNPKILNAGEKHETKMSIF